MQDKRRAAPELLAPAGSPLALKAAIEGGADAIYIGSTSFNARMNAKNFAESELAEGIELAHTYGAKVYVAANTLIFDRETDEYLRAAERAYLLGADAMIVADVGAAYEVKKRIPIELHASTQLSGHNVDAAKRLCEAGFSRMVLAREMTREDIEYFCKNSPIESEVFVHGALCVCHSGQCLFSSIVGGRSGNRGECAQPCRLPYGKRGEYPLSLKDLSLAEHVVELCEMGVSSFKIEGRMKSPEYVRDVTASWRALLDAGRNADRGEMEYLAKVFSRGGHTDAYFVKRIDSSMLGIRSDGDKRESRELERFEAISRRIPIEIRALIRRGEQSRLVARVGERTVSVLGAVPEQARTAPIDKETVRRSLSRLGDTAYRLDELSVELDEGLMLPVSALNSLRRAAVDALKQESLRSAEDIVSASRTMPTQKRQEQRSALFYQPRKMPLEAIDFFKYIYIPLESYSERRCEGLGVMLPEVIFDSERQEVERMLRDSYESGARDALVGNIGHIALAKKYGFRVHGDIRLNVANNSSVAFFEGEGVEDIILSPELSLAQIRDIGGASAVCVYGRLPLMITEKCVGRELGGCRACNSSEIRLVDRRGVSFPVLKRYKHRSAVFNSVPIYMADKRDELCRANIKAEHFIFSVESAREAARVIEAYSQNEIAPEKCRRIK